jgi:signal transduction histidine kinase/ligand-binding sensor domain-containing protein
MKFRTRTSTDSVCAVLGRLRCFQEQSPVKATTFGAEFSAIARALRRRAIVALGVLMAWCSSAFALDPALDISQYAHTAWKTREDFGKGSIHAIAQTSDGYLWLGTESGLLRFDGVRNVPWQPAGMALPHGRIQALLAARDGTLWIGTWGGLASWNGVKLIQYPELDGAYINALVEDREGTLWVVGRSSWPRPVDFLCAIRGGRTACTGRDGSLPELNSLYVDSQGVLWLAERNAVWRWKPGPPIAYPLQDEISSLHVLSETATGTMVVVTRSGLKQLIDGKFQDFSSRPMTPLVGAGGLLRDRDGAFWFATLDSGLRHVHEGRVDVFGQADGLSGDDVLGLFEDREGNVWVATVDGIDRFRSLAVATYSARQGILGPPSSVLADQDGSIWVSTLVALYRVHEARMTIDPGRPGNARAGLALTGTQRPMVDAAVVAGPPQSGGASLFQNSHGRIWIGAKSGLGYLDERGCFVAVSGAPAGYIDSIAEDRDGNLWIAHREAGLLRVSGDRVMQRFPWTSISQSGPASRLAVDSNHGDLWLGFLPGGIVQFVDGQVRASYSVRDGLGKGSVSDLSFGADGTLWAATVGGLSRIKAGRIATLDSGSGFPCDAVNSMVHDDDGAFWVHTACGLVRIAGSDLDAWVAAVDRGDAPPRIRATILDSSDGVRSVAMPTTFSPTATKSRDGKLWFVTHGGVEVVDPRRLPFNTLAPSVHIEQVTANRNSYEALPSLHLPPLIRDLEIDYTALSLAAPEKNQFRYRLEGHDRDWQDVGKRRQAFYNDLPPGNYRFRVLASNNSGVWNEQGAALNFSVAPTYWQTTWFRALCVAAFLVVLWALYQLRLRQIAHGFNARLESERRYREVQMELEHANRVATLGQLSASIAHEINQPIAAAVTNAQAALRWLSAQPPDIEEVRQSLDRIVKNGNRAAEVMGRTRALVKKAPPRKDDLEINEAIREVIALSHDEAVKNGVSVQTQLAEALPLIQGDGVQLQQVILNLILNAIQAMSGVGEGLRELLISTARGSSGDVLVAVRDSGPGLDPASLERVFEAFYTTKPGGLGIGLSICRSIIEAHGGRLWASAGMPRGATFQFTLPVP